MYSSKVGALLGVSIVKIYPQYMNTFDEQMKVTCSIFNLCTVTLSGDALVYHIATKK